MVVVMTWISLQWLVSKNKIMKNYLASYQEPEFLADEVCVFILSRILDVGIGVLTKPLHWQIVCQIARNILLIVGQVYSYLVNIFSERRKKF